jgi:hypothetical protein
MHAIASAIAGSLRTSTAPMAAGPFRLLPFHLVGQSSSGLTWRRLAPALLPPLRVLRLARWPRLLRVASSAAGVRGGPLGAAGPPAQTPALRGGGPKLQRDLVKPPQVVRPARWPRLPLAGRRGPTRERQLAGSPALRGGGPHASSHLPLSSYYGSFGRRDGFDSPEGSAQLQDAVGRLGIVQLRPSSNCCSTQWRFLRVASTTADPKRGATRSRQAWAANPAAAPRGGRPIITLAPPVQPLCDTVASSPQVPAGPACRWHEATLAGGGTDPARSRHSGAGPGCDDGLCPAGPHQS